VLAAQAPKLRALYQSKRDAMVNALRAAVGDGLSWVDPRGGFFLWAKLSGGLDADSLLERATAQGVIYVTGTAFFVDDSGSEFIRLSFSAPSEDRIREGVGRLARAMKEERKTVVPPVPLVPLVP
jgi:DNA-binding transcriptional MocR family regulator